MLLFVFVYIHPSTFLTCHPAQGPGPSPYCHWHSVQRVTVKIQSALSADFVPHFNIFIFVACHPVALSTLYCCLWESWFCWLARGKFIILTWLHLFYVIFIDCKRHDSSPELGHLHHLLVAGATDCRLYTKDGGSHCDIIDVWRFEALILAFNFCEAKSDLIYTRSWCAKLSADPISWQSV